MLGDKMSPYFDEYLHSIAAEGRIEGEDIEAMRTVLREEMALDRDIVEKLIDLDRRADAPREWRDFLSETIADLAVRVEGSLGAVSSDTSDWLVGQLLGPSGVPAPSAAQVIEAVVARAREPGPIRTRFAMALSRGPYPVRTSAAS